MAEFVVVGIKKIVTQAANEHSSGAFIWRPVVKRRTDWEYYSLTQKPTIRWNPGKKLHEVVLNDEVLFSTESKSEAETYIAA